VQAAQFNYVRRVQAAQFNYVRRVQAAQFNSASFILYVQRAFRQKGLTIFDNFFTNTPSASRIINFIHEAECKPSYQFFGRDNGFAQKLIVRFLSV